MMPLLIADFLALFLALLVQAALNSLSSVSIIRLSEDSESGSTDVRTFIRHRIAYLMTLQGSILLLSGAALALLILAGVAGGSLWKCFLICAAVAVSLSALAHFAVSFNPEGVLRFFLPALKVVVFTAGAVFIPVEHLVEKILAGHRERVDAEEEEGDREEEIATFIDVGEQEGIIEGDDSELIKSVMEFGNTVAREVMTPRTDMVCAEVNSVISKGAEILARARHTRLPLYEGQVDNIVGIAYLKDFLAPLEAGEGQRPLKEFARPAYFVPENKPISDLLREFQKQRVQLAIVVDEYGGVAGLVTTEDLLEEIVGEIQEADEAEQNPFVDADGGALEALGRASVDDLSEKLGVEIPSGDYDSAAGWISTGIGSIPHSGQVFELNGLKVEILSADKKRIHRVRISKLPAQNGAEG